MTCPECGDRLTATQLYGGGGSPRDIVARTTIICTGCGYSRPMTDASPDWDILDDAAERYWTRRWSSA